MVAFVLSLLWFLIPGISLVCWISVMKCIENGVVYSWGFFFLQSRTDAAFKVLNLKIPT